MAPGHGRGQPASRARPREQGQLSAHTAGVEATGKQVRGRPLEQLARIGAAKNKAPAAGPRRTCRLAEAGPVSHASARPPHVVVPAPGRLRPRSRPGSGARRRAAASPPPERSLRAALRGPAEAPRTSSEAPPLRCV